MAVAEEKVKDKEKGKAKVRTVVADVEGLLRKLDPQARSGRLSLTTTSGNPTASRRNAPEGISRSHEGILHLTPRGSQFLICGPISMKLAPFVTTWIMADPSRDISLGILFVPWYRKESTLSILVIRRLNGNRQGRLLQRLRSLDVMRAGNLSQRAKVRLGMRK